MPSIAHPHLERGFDIVSPLPPALAPLWSHFLDAIRSKYKSDKNVSFGETGIFFLFGDVPCLPLESASFRRFAGPSKKEGEKVGKRARKWQGYMNDVEGVAQKELGALIEHWDVGRGKGPKRGSAFGTDVYVGWGEVMPTEVLDRIEKNNKKD